MSSFKNKLIVIFNRLSSGDIAYLINGFKKRLKSENLYFGLKRDLTVPFKIPDAKIDINVRLIEEKDQKYFNMTHTEDGLIYENIPDCFVATTIEDEACFRQWFMRYAVKDKIESYFADMFPALKENEALLEGAFIPPAKRGLNIMEAGICRILENFKNSDVRYVMTFVSINNIASLKGIHRSGFSPYILRTEKYFLFKKKVIFTQIPDNLLQKYLKCVSG